MGPQGIFSFNYVFVGMNACNECYQSLVLLSLLIISSYMKGCKLFYIYQSYRRNVLLSWDISEFHYIFFDEKNMGLVYLVKIAVTNFSAYYFFFSGVIFVWAGMYRHGHNEWWLSEENLSLFQILKAVLFKDDVGSNLSKNIQK